MKSVKIKNKILEIPIIQGGMGIGVSLGRLAGSVMREGGMGVISAAHPGYAKPHFYEDSFQANVEALREEVAKAREISGGRGLLGVNVMHASKDYEGYIRAIVEMDVDVIISGAGLPLELPRFIGDRDIAIAPIVSSGRAAKLFLNVWQRRYGILPDFIVVEGPLAGGHLGFKTEELLAGKEESLETIVAEVVAEVQAEEARSGRKVPIFCGGGIFDGADIHRFLKMGVDGVQMGTRFVATEECDANQAFKERYLSATKADMIIVKSPVGMPGRAVKTAFMERVEKERQPIRRCFACLSTCNPAETPYCITQALIDSVQGRIDEGLVFAGYHAYRLDKIVPVRELMETLQEEYAMAEATMEGDD